MTDPIFKKLNFKDQNSITVLNAPSEFKPILDSMRSTAKVNVATTTETMEFLLIFVNSKRGIKENVDQVLPLLEQDSILWFAYPKKSSKKYNSDISRDDGWQILGDLGFEGVRMVSIDENWSALRLRKAEYIKTMKRDPKRAMSKTGLLKSKK